MHHSLRLQLGNNLFVGRFRLAIALGAASGGEPLGSTPEGGLSTEELIVYSRASV
jgi:hypothetical protein